VLAFSGKWIQPILDGKKTLTFRKWPTARVKLGGVYDAATIGYPPKKFARVEVTGLRKIKLGDIDDVLAKRDGAASAADVQSYWKKQGFKSDNELWLVEFRLHRP
jgi:hypothetical protein